jgi:hypothetical protein
MDSSKKLYIALALLVALGVAVYMQRQSEKKVEAAHSVEARAAELPKVEITDELIKEIDSVQITQPAKIPDAKASEDGTEETEPAAEGKATVVELIKKGEEDWELKVPVLYKANASNVTSLLNNLKSLKVSEEIASNAASYDKWGVSDEKGLHAVFKKGDQVVLDVYFGESGSRGQMTRLKDKEGVYAVKGYSKYLYARDVAGWRDKTIFKFDEKEAIKVTVQNDNGTFSFNKEGETWKGQFQAVKATSAKDIEEFKSSKVDDLLRAYKTLSASNFGDDKSAKDVGLEQPKATVTIELKGDSGKHVLFVGDTAEGTNRWVKTNAKDTVFSISSWSADWATADVTKFQDKKDEKKEEGDAEGMEGMPPMGMDMPTGHGPH